MNFSGKVAFLRDLIVNTLTPLISDSYVLWDLPYYTNIGDILIWEGTENFLKQLSSQCISKCSYQTFSYKPLPKDTTILLQGGGNFGESAHKSRHCILIYDLKIGKCYKYIKNT